MKWIGIALVLASLTAPVLADVSDGRTDVEITWLDNETFSIDHALYYGCIAETWEPSLADEYWDGSWAADCVWIDPPCGTVFHLCPTAEFNGVCDELDPGAVILFVFMGTEIPCMTAVNHDQPN